MYEYLLKEKFIYEKITLKSKLRFTNRETKLK